MRAYGALVLAPPPCFRGADGQGGDPLRENLPTIAAVSLIVAIHRDAGIAHPAAERFEGFMGIRVPLDAIAGVRDKSKKEGMEG